MTSDTQRVAHVVRELGLLTEPFIDYRIHTKIPGFEAETWTELSHAEARAGDVIVPSRLIRPGSFGARAFHHVPQLGRGQAASYRRVAQERKPALVHAHYLTTGVLAAACDRPLVVSTYGFDVSVMPRRPLWREAFRDLAQRVGAVLVEGPHMRDAVIALGFPVERIRIVRIVAGHEDLEFAPSTDSSIRPLRLLIAGRLVEKKGHVIALRAVARLVAAGRDVALTVVGAGPLERALRREAEALELGRHVTFLGSLPRDRYLDRVRETDLLLAPSVMAANGDSEGGAPTTILDAQAVGAVVVASTHADIPFLVDDGETGYLASEGDVDALVATIDRAVHERERWAAVRLAARQQVVERHSRAALVASLAAIYRQVGT